MGTAIHIELDALCLLMLCVIVWQSVRNVNKQMRKIRFRNAVYGIMIALVLDIAWMLVDGRIFPGGAALNRVLNALFLSASVLLGCMWYLYVLDALGYRVSRALSVLLHLPGLVFLVLNLLSIKTGWIFYVNEQNLYVRGPYFWVQEIGGVLMLLVSFFHILYCTVRRRPGVSMREIRKLLGFYVIPTAGTLVSMLYTGMPGTWTCAAVSVVLIYMTAQDREILRDSLTGLNNRKALDNAFSDYTKLAGPSSQLFLFMMDLDGLKGINDRNGHPMGDQALMVTAKLLLHSVQGMRSIVVRYGGDEFLVMGFPNNDPEAYRKRVRDIFSEYNASSDLPFNLQISVGYQAYESGLTLEGLITLADRALYRHKKPRRR